MSTIEVDGLEFKSLDKRVRIFSMADKPEGDLYELVSTKAILPQNFAKLDDGSMRDLRNDNYGVIDPEEAPSPKF
jgi:hypothetical protein